MTVCHRIDDGYMPTALASVLKAYRSARGLTQSQLGELLGMDQTYISKIESGQREIDDLSTLRRISDRLEVPIATVAGGLGIEIETAADTITDLAMIARHAGRPQKAIEAIQLAMPRLLASATSSAMPERVATLARAQIVLGSSLGDILPERLLSESISVLQDAIDNAKAIDDIELTAAATRAHGNELRKAGKVTEAGSELRSAAALTVNGETKGTALVWLSRVEAAEGNEQAFFEAIEGAKSLVTKGISSPVFNPVSVTEAEVRGLLLLDLESELKTSASRLSQIDEIGIAPQWQVIARVTYAETLLRLEHWSEARSAIDRAIHVATNVALPHQLERLAKMLYPFRDEHEVDEIYQRVEEAFERLILTHSRAQNVRASRESATIRQIPCLRCGRPFSSIGVANRFCERCRKSWSR